MAEVLPFISPAINIAKGIKDITDFVGRFNRADDDIIRAKGRLVVSKQKLDAWLGLWTNDRREPHSNKVYQHFWGSRGCEDVKSRLKLIKHGWKQVQKQLNSYEDARRHEYFNKARYVAFTAEDMRRILDDLREDISNLDSTTIHYFRRKLCKETGDMDIDGLPKEFANLAIRSEQLWSSLDIIRSLRTEDAQDTLLAMISEQESTGSNRRYENSVWTYLKGDCWSDLVLNLISDGRKTSLKYRVVTNDNHNSSKDINSSMRRINNDAILLDQVVIRSSLQECLQGLSRCDPNEQRNLFQMTNMDRVNAALDIAEWNLVAWDTDWTAGLCICNVRCVFEKVDSERRSPMFSLGVGKYDENHGCFTRDLKPSRHLLLAVVLASLALGCQIGVIHRRSGELCFTMNIDGHLQTMNAQGLLRKVVARSGRNNELWAHAVNHCLKLDTDRKGDGKLEPGDFHSYNEFVLEKLESYRKEVNESRSRRFAGGLHMTLQSVIDQAAETTET